MKKIIVFDISIFFSPWELLLLRAKKKKNVIIIKAFAEHR